MEASTLVTEFETKAAKVEADGFPFAANRELVQFARRHNIPRPRLVLRHGRKLLTHQSSLSHEAWTVLEQVFLAALQCCDDRVAEECLAALQRQFPSNKSARVELLVGRWKEYKGSADEAIAIYKRLLDANPANTMAAKRIIAVDVAAGRTGDAVVRLNDYLKTFGSDSSAWHELAQLYLESGLFQEASFCFEELVMLDPLNDVWHCLLGECLLTLSGADQTVAEHAVQARKHFSQAVKLSRGRNARALYGLAMATDAVDDTSSHGRGGRHDAGAGGGAGAGAGAGSSADANATLRAVAVDGLKDLFAKSKDSGPANEAQVLAMQVLQGSTPS